MTRHDAVPLPDKIEDIRQFPRPSTVRGLQEFVDMVTFYHRFVPAAARIMLLLFQLLSSKQRDVQWNDEAVAGPPDAPTTLMVDASDPAVGGARSS